MSSRQEVKHTHELALETIQQAMHAHQKTGFLNAQVLSGMVKLREPCRIEIKVVTGAVASCIVVGSSGRRMTGKEAIQALARLGRLCRAFTLEQEEGQSLSPAIVPTDGSALLSRRIASLDQEQMRSWTRLQRNIYALSDGTKSIIKISDLHSTTPELVEKAVRDLQAKGIMAMGSRSLDKGEHSV